MGNYVQFNQEWRLGGPRNAEDDIDTEIRCLPVVWRVIREYPEVRRAVEAAWEEARVRPGKNEKVA